MTHAYHKCTDHRVGGGPTVAEVAQLPTKTLQLVALAAVVDDWREAERDWKAISVDRGVATWMKGRIRRFDNQAPHKSGLWIAARALEG